MKNYKCYLPFRGEFGWYLIAFVKKFQGDYSCNKIVCIKPGHECLFPTAQKFYYDWQDISDDNKAGVITMDDEEEIKNKIKQQYPGDNITFISHTEIGWHNLHDYAQHLFLPKNMSNNNLKIDIVIAPRKRKVDSFRNWTKENWQYIVNKIVELGFTVGVCGAKESSFELDNVVHKSYDYIDVDSDVEMMLNSQLVICQESGMQYLSFLCKKPTICIDYYGSVNQYQHLHRDPNVPHKTTPYVWNNPQLLVEEILYFLQNRNFKPIVGDLPQDQE